MQSSTALLHYRAKRGLGIKTFAWKHHGRAHRGRGEHTQHHAKAVIERHRNTQAVIVGQCHGLGRKPGVVDDVEMTQRGTLGVAGGAAGELDIDGVIRVERGRQIFQSGMLCRASLA